MLGFAFDVMVSFVNCVLLSGTLTRAAQVFTVHPAFSALEFAIVWLTARVVPNGIEDNQEDGCPGLDFNLLVVCGRTFELI